MTSVYLNIPLTLVSSLGLLFNGYIVIAVLLTRQVTSANNILLLHLGTVDVLLGVLFLAFSVPGFTTAKPGWLTDGFPCVVHGFFHTLLHPLALWTICGLNCDRYYAIAAPLHYSHIVNPKKVLAGLGAGWVISLLLCIPPLFTVAPYGYVGGLEACAPRFSFGTGALWYSTIYTAFTLLLPATLIICCNLKILMIARYHRHRIASAIYEVTLSAQVTITHQRNPFFVPTVTAPAAGGPKFRGRSAIYTVLQLVGSLIVFYLPYYCLVIWEATTGSFQTTAPIHPHFFTTAMVLLICSPGINGFLYGVKSKPLRKTFQNYWRKKQHKSEVNQEIQARTPSTCGSRRPSLTPLGFFNNKSQQTLQRRLSEALLDVHKAVNSPQRHKIKRITTDLNWRPASANSLNIFTRDDGVRIKETASCNTLQVPVSDTEISMIAEDNNHVHLALKEPVKNTSSSPRKLSSANMFLHRFFVNQNENNVQEKLTKKSEVVQNILDGTPKHSPRITITRTYSEESDSSPRREVLSKKHSVSSNTIFERKWRQLNEDKADNPTRKPLLDNSSVSNGSDSSESSESSGGKIFMAMDGHCKHEDEEEEEEDSPENESLLSWVELKKSPAKQALTIKQKTIQQNVVL